MTRHASWVLAIAAFHAAASASSDRSVTLVAVDEATSKVKATVVTDPAAALPRLAVVANRADTINDKRERTLARAAIARLEAEAYLRLGKSELAEPLLARSIVAVRKLAPASPILPDLLLSRGGLNVERAQVAKALTDFHAAYDLFGKLRDQKSQAKALLSIAYLYFEAKDYASVIKYADQAQEVHGGDPMILMSVYNNRALALNELGRFREAGEQFTRALATARAMKSAVLEAQVLRNLARTRLLVGAPLQAEQAIREVRQIAPVTTGAEGRATDALAAQIELERGRLGRAKLLIDRSFAGVDLSATQLSSREAHRTAYQIYAARREFALALAHLVALKRLDDEATKLATTTSTALMGARFDFANQELKIANLQRDEARRSVAFERARAGAQRTLFLGGAGAVAVIIVLLLVGLFTIRRSRDKVRAVAADLRVSNDALGKALAAKTEFLATTSHEIRTPLNGILGMTQVILADGKVEPTLRDRIQLVHAAGTTMRALVDDILDVAKMETGNLTIEAVPFDPRATLNDAARLWEDQARARGLVFHAELEACPSVMTGDAARLRQIAFNLLSNAMKFTREGGVTLRAERRDAALTIAVADTGVGIPADKLGEIFESFRQADAGTTREFGGTGLGLSICRSLAEAMGGTITVESAPGRGSTFTVTLPCRDCAPIVEVAATRECAVLVVERNPIARAMLKTLFAPRGPVVAVASGAEALAWIGGNDALAVVADAASFDRVEQAALATYVSDKSLILLCGDANIAEERSAGGWRAVVRPVAGARLVAMVCNEGVVSNSDTLAAQAA